MPDDLNLGVIPSENPVFTSEENLRLAAAEAVNNTLEINPVQPDEEVIVGRGWVFDFTTNQFRRQGGTAARISGEDQIRAWIEKAIYTSRFAHPVFSDQYGVEGLTDIIGRQDPGNYARVQSSIRDALLVHDQIAEVDDFKFEEVDEALFVEFTVTLRNNATISIPFTLTGAA